MEGKPGSGPVPARALYSFPADVAISATGEFRCARLAHFLHAAQAVQHAPAGAEPLKRSRVSRGGTGDGRTDIARGACRFPEPSQLCIRAGSRAQTECPRTRKSVQIL